jgi:trimeric autotransporter adhesin
MTVNTTTKVANLNADLLDGKDAADFVAKADYDALAARVAELEKLLASVSLQTVDGQPTVRFSGVNVQIVNGQGSTTTSNGRGNLLLGYNEQRSPAVSRTGSHYLVIGREHQWTTHSGIVSGFRNTATGQYSSVTGGDSNVAFGNHSSVSGGTNNTASGAASSVSGGSGNTASGTTSSVSGGSGNTASGGQASVSGGFLNSASGPASSILGGQSKSVTTSLGCHPSCA